MTIDGTILVNKIYNLVVLATRPMPAYFTSGNDREKCFGVDFDNLTKRDEYEMACIAYNEVENYIKISIDTAIQRNWIVKLGEDIIISAYITAKLGDPTLSKEVAEMLTKENIRRFRGVHPDLDVDKSYNLSGLQEYLSHCQNRGLEIASRNL